MTIQSSTLQEPQVIGIGAAPNDGTGDPIRVAMEKVNTNFSYIDTQFRRVLDAFSFVPKEITSFYVGGNQTLYEKGFVPDSFTLYWSYEGMTRNDISGLNEVRLEYIDASGGLVFSQTAGLKDTFSFTVDNTDERINGTGRFVLTIDEDSPENINYRHQAEIKITFLPKIYWGSSLSNDLPAADIIRLFGGEPLQNDLSTEKSREIMYRSVDGEYIYYVFPAELGTLTYARVNGILFTAYNVSTLDIVNTYGHQQEYLVYRFDYPQFGTNILVEWS